MNTKEIIKQLKAERDRLSVAIAALNGQPKRHKARRKAAKRKMSAAARKCISKAQKARWKKFKASKKS